MNAKTPAKARRATLKIFQIYYRDEQRSGLDPAFTPYDNRGVASPLLEYEVFRTILARRLAGNASLWGAVSWKFGRKTGLGGAELAAHVHAHPGYDAYYCNPFPEFEAIYHNLWQQGETAHPGFLDLAREFFAAAGLPDTLIQALYPGRIYSAANYIVARPAFWRAYLGFVDGLLDRVERNGTGDLMARLHSAAADARGRHAGACYLPFIVERLFSVFLLSAASAGFRVHQYPLPAREIRLDAHLKVLREQKELLCRQHNRSLAAWWLSHRGLYFLAVHGREWTHRYLPRISPGKIITLPVHADAD